MNSAQRLEALFAQLRSTPPNASQPNTPPTGVDAWSTLFNRHGESGQELEDAAAECALAIAQELINLGHELQDLGVPSGIYMSHIVSLRAITSTRNLHGNWQNLAGMVREDQMTMLQWAGYVLGLEQSEQHDAEVERLSSEIDQLILDAENSALPPILRMFILRNLRSIRDALWRYKVSGPSPLRNALRTVNGTSHAELNALQPAATNLQESDRSIIERFGDAFSSAANVCDVATKLQGGYVLAAAAATALGFGG
jgi:hypothetical protein